MSFYGPLRSFLVMPESGSRAFFVVNLLMLQLRVFFCRECHIYALFLSGMSWLRAFWGRILHRNLAEILRNTQNFGRNSEEKIGWWSLCSEVYILQNKAGQYDVLVIREDTCVPGMIKQWINGTYISGTLTNIRIRNDSTESKHFENCHRAQDMQSSQISRTLNTNWTFQYLWKHNIIVIKHIHCGPAPCTITLSRIKLYTMSA